MGAVARTRRNLTMVLGSLIAVLGIVLIATTVARGGGPIALGVVIGACFILFGCARVYLAAASRSPDRT